jgi:hypothetical protein
MKYATTTRIVQARFAQNAGSGYAQTVVFISRPDLYTVF